MIYDSLKNMAVYKDLPVLKKAIEHYLSHNLMSIKPGVYEIEGKDLYLKVEDYITKDPSAALTETHEKYIDLQMILEGEEYIGYCTKEECGEPVESRPESDVWFYKAKTQVLKMSGGTMMILFPNEGHQPCMGNGKENKRSHKAVYKINVEKYQ